VPFVTRLRVEFTKPEYGIQDVMPLFGPVILKPSAHAAPILSPLQQPLVYRSLRTVDNRLSDRPKCDDESPASQLVGVSPYLNHCAEFTNWHLQVNHCMLAGVI